MSFSRRRALILIKYFSIGGCAWAIATRAGAQPELVIYKEGTPFYHRPDCPAIKDSVGVLALTRGQANARGYKPHPACDPANPNLPSEARPGSPPPPITVYIDGPKYYHRQTCAKLDAQSKSLKPMPLETVAKTHWPCPACKAPVLKRNIEPAIPGTNRRRGG